MFIINYSKSRGFLILFLALLSVGITGCIDRLAKENQELELQESSKQLVSVARNYLKDQDIKIQILNEVECKELTMYSFNNFYAPERIIKAIWELDQEKGKVLIVYCKIIWDSNSASKRRYVPFKYVIKDKDSFFYLDEMLGRE